MTGPGGGIAIIARWRVALVAGVVLLLALPAEGASAREAVPVAVALPTPKRLWVKYPVKLPEQPAATDGAGLVFVLRSDRGKLVALDLTTGRERWAAALPSDPSSTTPSWSRLEWSWLAGRTSDWQRSMFAAASGSGGAGSRAI